MYFRLSKHKLLFFFLFIWNFHLVFQNFKKDVEIKKWKEKKGETVDKKWFINFRLNKLSVLFVKNVLCDEKQSCVENRELGSRLYVSIEWRVNQEAVSVESAYQLCSQVGLAMLIIRSQYLPNATYIKGRWRTANMCHSV